MKLTLSIYFKDSSRDIIYKKKKNKTKKKKKKKKERKKEERGKVILLSIKKALITRSANSKIFVKPGVSGIQIPKCHKWVQGYWK